MEEAMTSEQAKRTVEAVEAAGLKKGAHKASEAGMCALEAVAWLAEEPHSDSPQCACPVIASFVRRLNDIMTNGERKELVPLLQGIIGTKGSSELERKRGFACADWAVRVILPMRLDHYAQTEGLESLAEHAAALRDLPKVVDRDTALAAKMLAVRVRDAAYVAYNAADAAYVAYVAYNAAAAAASYVAYAAAAAAASYVAYAAAAASYVAYAVDVAASYVAAAAAADANAIRPQLVAASIQFIKYLCAMGDS